VFVKQSHAKFESLSSSVISCEVNAVGRRGVRVIWFKLQPESLERPQSKAATGTVSPAHTITSLKAN